VTLPLEAPISSQGGRFRAKPLEIRSTSQAHAGACYPSKCLNDRLREGQRVFRAPKGGSGSNSPPVRGLIGPRTRSGNHQPAQALRLAGQPNHHPNTSKSRGLCPQPPTLEAGSATWGQCHLDSLSRTARVSDRESMRKPREAGFLLMRIPGAHGRPPQGRGPPLRSGAA
jgi:hypothetical protein